MKHKKVNTLTTPAVFVLKDRYNRELMNGYPSPPSVRFTGILEDSYVRYHFGKFHNDSKPAITNYKTVFGYFTYWFLAGKSFAKCHTL